MPYRRRVLRYGPSPDELQSSLDERVVSGCTFELHRLGGCGSGQLRLKDSFDSRAHLGVGEWVACEYDDGQRWYLGRIEERRAESPGGVTLRLEGMSIQLNEVFPGGFGSERDGAKPHRYALSDRFDRDPDRAAETVDNVERPEDVIRLLLQQYVVPATDIRVDDELIEDAPFGSELVSLKLNGEETVRSTLKDLALRLRNASWGVDEQGRFFLLQARETTLATYQEGIDLIELREEQTRDAIYNRVLLTGGYVYGSPAIDTAVTAAVRWRGNYRQPASIQAHGERRLRIWVSWIRTTEDSRQFVREFFRVYAQPANRYAIQVAGVASCPRPWLGRVRVLDRHGDTLVTGQPETIRVRFDNTPRLLLEIGPDDPRIHWPEPPHDERFPVAKSPLASGQSGGGGPLTLTQDSGDGEPSDAPSSETSAASSSGISSGPESSEVLSSDVVSSDLTSVATDLSDELSGSEIATSGSAWPSSWNSDWEPSGETESGGLSSLAEDLSSEWESSSLPTSWTSSFPGSSETAGSSGADTVSSFEESSTPVSSGGNSGPSTTSDGSGTETASATGTLSSSQSTTSTSASSSLLTSSSIADSSVEVT